MLSPSLLRFFACRTATSVVFAATVTAVLMAIVAATEAAPQVATDAATPTTTATATVQIAASFPQLNVPEISRFEIGLFRQ